MAIKYERIIDWIDIRAEYKKLSMDDEAERVAKYLRDHGIFIRDTKHGTEWSTAVDMLGIKS